MHNKHRSPRLLQHGHPRLQASQPRQHPHVRSCNKQASTRTCARMVDPILSPSAAMAEAGGPRKRMPVGVSSRASGSSGFSDAWPLYKERIRFPSQVHLFLQQRCGSCCSGEGCGTTQSTRPGCCCSSLLLPQPAAAGCAPWLTSPATPRPLRCASRWPQSAAHWRSCWCSCRLAPGKEMEGH